MKNIFCFILLISSSSLLSNNPIEPKHQISAVTVFSKGAMISRSIELNTLIGEHTLSIKNLPPDIYNKSIVLEANDNIAIKSINYFLTSKQEVHKFQLDSLQSETEIILDSINYKNTLINILSTEKSMITSHGNFTNKEGNANIDDIIKASEFYKKRIKEIDLSMLHLHDAVSDLNSTLRKKQIEIEAINIKSQKQSYQVDIKVNIKQKNAENIILKYFVPNAQWHPFYDLMVKDIQSPSILSHKAFVSQNTGEEWSNIKLTLSNANPTENNILPQLNPKELTSPEQRLKTIKGKVIDNYGEPLIGVNVIIEGTANGTVSDIEGNFILHYATHRNLIVSYVGFNSKRIFAPDDFNVIVLDESNHLLEEVTITGHASGGHYSLDDVNSRKKREKDFNDKLIQNDAMQNIREAIKLSKNKNITAVEFILDERYSLASDNKEIDVLLETKTVPCTYEYFAVPSKSSKSFLTLQINEWHKLDLLAGEVNLFLGNTFKGSSVINPNISDEVLSISIGSDPEVIVEQNLKNEFYDKKFLNKKIEEYFTFEITVKNNKSIPIDIKILDQIPISNHESIEIKNVEIATGVLNEDSGLIEWIVTLPSGETTQNSIAYSIKYPREFGSIF